MVLTRRLSAAVAVLALCSAVSVRANASTFPASGNFSADNSFFEYSFSETSAADFTAATTSFAAGGFAPVLTLFNATTGSEIDNDGSFAPGDASLSDVLGAGSYDLFLTEFPNAALGNLGDGFLLDTVSDPTTFTGDNCGVAGGMFYNSVSCTPTGNNYALTASSSAVTPEPASWLLVLPPALLLLAYRRRFV